MRTAVVYNFLLEANLMASIAILLMLPIRRFLRGRLGSRAIYFAWLLVAVRLLCPLHPAQPGYQRHPLSLCHGQRHSSHRRAARWCAFRTYFPGWSS